MSKPADSKPLKRLQQLIVLPSRCVPTPPTGPRSMHRWWIATRPSL